MTIGNYTEMDSNCAERKKKSQKNKEFSLYNMKVTVLFFFSVKIYKFSNV